MKMKKLRWIIVPMLLFMMGISPLVPAKAEAPVQVRVNGVTLSFDQPPVLENSRVLVPVRAIFEALHAKVSWTESTRRATAVKDNTTVTMQIGSRIMYQNAQPVLLDVAPTLKNDRTLVPLRAVSESFGASVNWSESQRLVTITTDGAGNEDTNPGESNPGESNPGESNPGESNEPVETSLEYQVFQLVNQERANAGLNPLTWHDGLANVARAHSKDMNDRNFFAHNNLDGLTPFDRIKNAGISYTRAAENIAAGQKTAQEVMTGWMNSSGHRANILNPNLKMIGVGYYKGSGSYQTYWTQCFITQ